MMLIKKPVFICSMFLLVSLNVNAQHELCGKSNTSFQTGEKLNFRVYYNMGAIWVNAGEVNFTTEDGKVNGHRVYHISGDGRTMKSHDWIFKVRDKYETFIDKKTMLPVKFLRNVNEGGYTIFNDVNFDHEKGTATSTNGCFKIPECTQDVLSAIYYARNINYEEYEPGDKIAFNLFLDDKIYPLYIRYIGKEEITTRFGTFKAIKIQPLLIEGTIFKGGEKMKIWVSDDKNHLPLRINSPILVGSIKVDLMGYDNLKYPFKGVMTRE
jgi:hypothetical protein